MSEEKAEAPCPHDDWVIRGRNKSIPPHGTCLKCGEELPLYILLNAWKARIERELKERT